MKKDMAAVGLFFGLFWVGGSFCHIYKAFVRKSLNEQTKTYQTVIGFGDFHDKAHPANKQQREYIDSLLKRCAALKSKVIVEDLSSVNNDGRMMCCNYAINCSDGILGRLAHKARSLGVEVDNVEYRYCRVASIGPLLNNLQLSPYSCISSASITTKSLINEVADEIEKIKKYNDGKVLNAAYKRTLHYVTAAFSKIAFNSSNAQRSIADVCFGLCKRRYRQELENMCVFDSSLVDMKIIHSVVLSPNVPSILIIAGGAHIEQVDMLLEKLGYKNCIEAGDLVSSASMQKALNSDFTGNSSFDSPRAIDLSFIEKYLR